MHPATATVLAAVTDPPSTFWTEALPWLSAIGIIITILTAAAAAAGFFRATAARTTLELQRISIETLEKRLDQVLEESKLLTASNLKLTAENDTLRDALSHKAEIERLEIGVALVNNVVENHHKQVMEERALDRVSHEARFDKIDHTLVDIKSLLGDNRRTP